VILGGLEMDDMKLINEMNEIILNYGLRYINDSTLTKTGYCQRCLNEGRLDATEKKTLYEYFFYKGRDTVYVCDIHVGFLEHAREAVMSRKPMNDIEKMRSKKELKELIEEGKDLMKL
jgi:hypothetical protein